jgi:hypothetical protein
MDFFAPFLRRGDFLMAHDYFPDQPDEKAPSRASVDAVCAKHGMQRAVPTHWPDGSLILLRKT